jgi:DNA-binding response OmpR family regulator
MKKILICEDDLAMMAIIEFTLKRDPTLEVVKAADGKQAIEEINKNEFDVIITDVHMPFHTGLEIIEYIRTVKRLSIPILVLSVEGLEEIELQAFRLGADDYIIKPFNPIELSLRIKRYLQ